MDWNEIRRNWQSSEPAVRPDVVLHEVEARDRKLRSMVARRDLLETIVAVAIAPVFAWIAWQAAARDAWQTAFFAAAITAWICYVPVRLWRTRRRLPPRRQDLPLLDHLRGNRDAMLAQARMLEQIGWWYLAPCAFGVCGLVLSVAGVTPKTVAYTGFVLGLCVLIGYANRVAARTVFRAHAHEIERQIASMTSEET